MVKRLYSVTEENVQQLKWMCETTGLNASDLVRRMIEGSYARMKKGVDAAKPGERMMGIIPDVVLEGVSNDQ